MIAIVAISVCDFVDDSPCAEKKTFDLYLFGAGAVDGAGDLLNSYLEGNNRVMQ